jgi:hypothetical protein
VVFEQEVKYVTQTFDFFTYGVRQAMVSYLKPGLTKAM